MGYLAKILPTVSEDPGAQRFDYDDLIAAGFVVPETEPWATEDYLFNRPDASVLRSRRGGAKLEQQGLAPTYGTNSLTLAAGANGLKLAAVDTGTFTVAVVFQRPMTGPTGVIALMGTEDPVVDPVGNVGAGLYIQANGGLAFSIRPGAGDPIIPGAVADAAIPRGAWAFLAGTISPEGASIFLGQANGNHIITNSVGPVTHDLGGRVALGKVLPMGGSYDNAMLTLHRALFAALRLSAVDLNAAYRRVAVVAARCGITLA